MSREEREALQELVDAWRAKAGHMDAASSLEKTDYARGVVFGLAAGRSNSATELEALLKQLGGTHG